MKTSFLRLSIITFILCSFIGSSNAFSDQAPNFKLNGQKNQIELSGFRGKIVYLDFWASWCQPCRKSFTWMNKMQSLYGAEGFTVIAVNLDESRSNANKFLKQIPTNFEVAFDPQGNTAKTYKVKAMPSSYLIDKNGELVSSNQGFRGNDEDELENKIRTLLRKSTIASR